MGTRVRICDATLWLGEQAPGFSMSAKEKSEIGKQLSRLGVDVIEVGYPDKQTAEVTAAIASSGDAVVSIMSNASEDSVMAAASALERIKNRRISVVALSSDSGLIPAVKLASGLCDAELVISDASELSEEKLAELVEAASNAGAKTICICDGAGYCAPTEFYHIVKNARDHAGKAAISVMCGNDLGMATANALSAVKAGAVEVKCAVGGVGFRAGTASLEELAMGLKSREDYYGCEVGISTRHLYRTSKLVSTVLGYQIEPNRPIIGDNALSQVAESGRYSVIKPEMIGVFRNNIVLGKFSTRADFETRVNELGYLLTPAQLDEGYEKFAELCERKKTVSDRDVEAIAEPMSGGAGERFELVNFVINSGTMFPSTSTIIMKVAGEQTTHVETGSGPVDASFKAIDRITGIDVKLENYALQSVTEGEDALGDAVVKVRYNDRVFTGRGLSTDVIEASVRAYINALNKIAVTIQ